MSIPGEDLPNSHPAISFVGWYNGHPDYRELPVDLTCGRAVVVGNGNVAMDVARILATAPMSWPRPTSPTTPWRRCGPAGSARSWSWASGAAQASCTTPELKELGKLDGVGVVVDPANVELARASRTVVEEDRTARANLKILREYAARDPPRRPAPHRPALPVLGRPSSSGAAAASPACGSSATSWSRTPRAGSGPRARASST